MKKNKGQQAIEFAILIGLVFIVALLTVMIFGENLYNFFSHNAISQTSSKTPIKNNNPYAKPDEAVEPAETSGASDTIIETTNEIVNSPKFQTMLKEFETTSLGTSFEDATGASGQDFILKEIQKLLAANKDKYPNGDYPLEIIWGNGERGTCQPETVTTMEKTANSVSVSTSTSHQDTTISQGTCVKGSAQANMVTLKLDNQLVIIQNDQSCKANDTVMNDCPYEGVHVLSGSIDANNKYTAEVTSYTDTADNVTLKTTYTADIDTSSGSMVLKNGDAKISETTKTKTGNISTSRTTGGSIPWNFNFNEAS